MRADRRRLRRARTAADQVEHAITATRRRMAACTPDQRRRVAWHVLACLPAPTRRDVLRRHLPTLMPDTDPDGIATAAATVSGRLDEAYRVPSARLRLLRKDIP